MAPTIPWQLFVSVGLELLSRPERDFFSLILITHGVFQILSEGTADWMCMMDRKEKLLDFKNKTKKTRTWLKIFHTINKNILLIVKKITAVLFNLYRVGSTRVTEP